MGEYGKRVCIIAVTHTLDIYVSLKREVVNATKEIDVEVTDNYILATHNLNNPPFLEKR